MWSYVLDLSLMLRETLEVCPTGFWSEGMSWRRLDVIFVREGEGRLRSSDQRFMARVRAWYTQLFKMYYFHFNRYLFFLIWIFFIFLFAVLMVCSSTKEVPLSCCRFVDKYLLNFLLVSIFRLRMSMGHLAVTRCTSPNLGTSYKNWWCIFPEYFTVRNMN